MLSMTVPEQIASPREDVTPDWAILPGDILCPLCDYNLRGLAEPRCPECGHQFVWNEVLTLGDRTHPYLFEHQWHRSLWSFFKTLSGSLSPPSFWRTLRPMHSPVLNRLVFFWAILALPALLTITVICALSVMNARSVVRAMRQSQIQALTDNLAYMRNSDPQIVKDFFTNHGSVQAYAEKLMPLPGLVDGIRRNGPLVRNALPIALMAIAWPWLTMLALMVFRISLTRAKIKAVHVMRCTLYSTPAVLLIAPVVILAAIWDWRWMSPARAWWAGNLAADALVVIFAGLLIVNWSLVTAYRSYLGFPHAVATVALSQTMVILAMLKVYFLVLGY